MSHLQPNISAQWVIDSQRHDITIGGKLQPCASSHVAPSLLPKLRIAADLFKFTGGTLATEKLFRSGPSGPQLSFGSDDLAADSTSQSNGNAACLGFGSKLKQDKWDLSQDNSCLTRTNDQFIFSWQISTNSIVSDQLDNVAFSISEFQQFDNNGRRNANWKLLKSRVLHNSWKLVKIVCVSTIFKFMQIFRWKVTLSTDPPCFIIFTLCVSSFEPIDHIFNRFSQVLLTKTNDVASSFT